MDDSRMDENHEERNGEQEEEYFQKSSWKTVAQQDLPFLPTSMECIETTFAYLKKASLISPEMTVIDLGAGDGRVIVYTAEKFGLNSIGVEINRELIETAQKRIEDLKLGKICAILEADLYNYDLSHGDIIFCFILPSSHRFFKHVAKSIKPGAIIISSRWDFDAFSEYLEPIEILNCVPENKMYIYRKK